MNLGAPLGLLTAALVGPLVLWYVLRSRRPRVTVSSTFLWQQARQSVAAAVPWQRFRADATFWLVLLALLAGTLAMAQPYLRVPTTLGDHTILVLDASGSMLADEEGPTRLELARREADALVESMAPGQTVSVVEAGARARVLLSDSDDPNAVRDAVRGVRVGHGPADLGDAFTLAAALQRPGQDTVLHLLTDGAVPAEHLDDVPPGLRVTAVGDARPNLGITRLQAVPVGAGSSQVFVQVRNHGQQAARAQLTLSVEGTEVVSERFRIPPRASEDRVLTVSGGDGDVLGARVSPVADDAAAERRQDALTVDDQAFALLSAPREVQVALATPGNVFLRSALESVAGVTVEESEAVPDDLGDVDLLVVDRVAAPDTLDVPTLLVGSTSWPEGIDADAAVDQPTITHQDSDHELTASVDLSGVAVAEATPLQSTALTPLAGGPSGDLLLAGRLEGTPVVAVGFDLLASNLPLDASWPVLVANTIAWLAGPPATLPAQAGSTVTVPIVDGATSAEVTSPSGRTHGVDPASPRLTVDEVGLWRIDQQGEGDLPAGPPAIAVNPVPGEGDLARPGPDTTTATGGTGAEADGPVPAEGRQPLGRHILLAVLVLAVLEWAWAHRRAPGRHRAATVVRATAVGLLVLALAAPRLTTRGTDMDVAFLVDASDSVGVGARVAEDWVRTALEARGGDDRAAVALFGADPRVEYALQEDPPTGSFATVVDGSATDIASALRLSQGVLGGEQRRRVVLFTDGRQTGGDAVTTAAELAEAGVDVDIVPIGGGTAVDVLVEEVRAPDRVRDGEAYEVVGVLRNTGGEAVEVEVVTTADGDEIDRRTVTAEPGRTEVVVPREAESSGTVRHEVRLVSSASAVPENDVGRAAVQVDGPPSVLLMSGEEGAADHLAAAMAATGVEHEVLDATSSPLPPLDVLLAHEATVLVDVPADLLGDDGMQTLDAYVRDAGHGLVAVGGDDAFGMGEYDGTTLEDLLPVFARVRDPERRPSVAEALVVDVSGSMAACHCRQDGFPGGPDGGMVEGGVNKTDITKEGVARAIGALAPQDTVGVLAFNAEANWVLPLQQVPDSGTVDDALARLHPDGPTDVVNALEEAIAGLRDVNARLRHIVLFTDGFSEDPRMIEAAEAAAEEGITLSVVATGEGTGEVLERMADAGGGRYYPGRDLSSIPDILVSEVQLVSRPIITEGVFTPTLAASHAAVDDLEATPPLLGYLATTEKPTASTPLRVGEQHDPLLATWQAGAGTAVAWTSDATARWSQQWVGWDTYATFWSDVVRSTFPAATSPDFGVDATVSGGTLEVEVGAADPLPEGATATATVTLPNGERVDVDLPRTDLDRFAGQLPGGEQGVYAVTVQVTRGEEVLYRDVTTAIRSYSPEYAPTEDDAALLAAIAAAGEGRLDPEPAEAFDRAGLDPGSSTRALWPWLALLGLVLLPVDVGIRRLRLTREDLPRWLRRLTRRAAAPATTSTTTPPAPPARAPATDPPPPAPEDEQPPPPPPPEPEPPRSAAGDLRRRIRDKGGDVPPPPP